MEEAGVHWRQKEAWKPAGSWIRSLLHSRGILFDSPPRPLLVSSPTKISARAHCACVCVCVCVSVPYTIIMAMPSKEIQLSPHLQHDVIGEGIE